MTIHAEKKPGTLARSIASLRRAGFDITHQRTEERAAETVIQLIVEGSAANSADFDVIIGGLEGVRSLQTDYQADQGQSRGMVIEAQQGRDDPAHRIAAVYPDIRELIDELKKGYGKRLAPAKMRELGIQVVTLRAEKIPKIARGASLTEVCDLQLIPEIRPIAQARTGDGGLEILNSIFTDRQNKRKKGLAGLGFSLASSIDDDADRCDFLCGYVQGVINTAPWLGDVQVSEAYCRSEGEPYCLFEFS